MVAEMKTVLVLVGPNAGKTIKLNNISFADGEAIVTGTADSIGHVINYYRAHSAYPKGSEELTDAQARYEQHLQETGNGIGHSGSTPKSGAADGVSGAVRSPGTESAEAGTVLGAGHASDPSGDSGAGSSGAGRADAGLSGKSADAAPDASVPAPVKAALDVSQPLIKAILVLDPANNEHWTEDGKPKISFVSQALGNSAVNRREIEDAIPGWTRDAARAYAVAEAKDLASI